MSTPIFTKSPFLSNTPLHYCPGCTHGIVHRLIAESICELNQQHNTIGVAPVGCAVFAYKYFNCDFVQAAHGRAPAVATGIKRAQPDKLLFVYQGDGDLASIGMAETVHAAARNENITIIFINNGIYGMTGGQMAPTTLMGQKTTTSQDGRNAAHGNPIKVCEMLATFNNLALVARSSTHNVREVKNTKALIKQGLQNQIDKKGFSIIEILSTCPTNFHQTPQAALDFIRDAGIKEYPLGTFKQ